MIVQAQEELEVVVDETVYKEMYDSVERAAATAIGLDAEQDMGIIKFLTWQQQRLLKAKEILSLQRKVKRLEKKKKSITHGLKRLYKVGLSTRVESYAKEQSLDEEDASKQGRNIADIDADAKTTLVDETTEDQGRYNDQDMFDTGVLDDEEVVVEKAVVVKEVDVAQDQVSTATTIAAKDSIVDDITLAKALKALKTLKPKIRGIVVRDHEEPKQKAVRLKQKKVLREQGRIFNKNLPRNRRCGMMYGYKLIMKLKWHMIFLDWSEDSLEKDMYLNEVFGRILLGINEAFNEET
nr:hypothetical protein [Tanacetum cinerariifolium]